MEVKGNQRIKVDVNGQKTNVDRNAQRKSIQRNNEVQKRNNKNIQDIQDRIDSMISQHNKNISKETDLKKRNQAQQELNNRTQTLRDEISSIK